MEVGHTNTPASAGVRPSPPALHLPFLFLRHAGGASSPLNNVWSFHSRLVTARYRGHMTCSFTPWPLWISGDCFPAAGGFLQGQVQPFMLSTNMKGYQVLTSDLFSLILPQKGATLGLPAECNNKLGWKHVKSSLGTNVRLQCPETLAGMSDELSIMAFWEQLFQNRRC